MNTVLHTADLVESALGDLDDLAADYHTLVEEYVPTTEDMADYHAWSADVERRMWDERIEREDRMDAQERIRREAFNAARSAACMTRGIASALKAYGLDSIARRLVAASDDVMNLVTRYG